MNKFLLLLFVGMSCLLFAECLPTMQCQHFKKDKNFRGKIIKCYEQVNKKIQEVFKTVTGSKTLGEALDKLCEDVEEQKLVKKVEAELKKQGVDKYKDGPKLQKCFSEVD